MTPGSPQAFREECLEDAGHKIRNPKIRFSFPDYAASAMNLTYKGHSIA